MCTEEGRLRTIGVALSFKVRNSRSWSKLEPADFRNGVRLVYHEGNIGTTSNVMSDIPLIDYASLDEHTRQRLAAVIATHTSLERALNWGRTQRPPLAVEAILTQDEYTHDVLIPFENRYLVYDTT